MFDLLKPVAPSHALPACVDRPRVALVCDLVEENWPSMDLVAEMLFAQLQARHSSEFSTVRLCPPMRRRFTRLPMPGRTSFFFNVDRLVNRFADYPRWLRTQAPEFDLFHVVDHSYAQLVHHLPAARTVVTCHDLDTFRCLLDPEREKRSRWFRAMTERILGGLQKAAHVITGSSAVQEQIVRYRLIPPDRISVISNGVHPSCSSAPNPAADAELARHVPVDFSHSTWLLNVGSVIPRKRIDVLLRVFAAVRREIPEVCLVRVGGGFTPAQRQLARQLGVEKAVLVLPHVARPVLAAVYRRADLLIHTAEAEGFGLPLIEALACGCPVVASDIAVLREVGGAAAVYCPVAEINAWKETVIGLLRERAREGGNGRLRSKQGEAHAAGFSWAECARQTTGVYRAVLEQAGVTSPHHG